MTASTLTSSSLPPRPPGGSAPSGGSGAATDPKLRDAAQRFEAIFLRQMLARARATDFGGESLTGGKGVDSFTEMRDARFADIAAESGSLGIARMLEAQLARSPGGQAGG